MTDLRVLDIQLVSLQRPDSADSARKRTEKRDVFHSVKVMVGRCKSENMSGRLKSGRLRTRKMFVYGRIASAGERDEMTMTVNFLHKGSNAANDTSQTQQNCPIRVAKA